MENKDSYFLWTVSNFLRTNAGDAAKGNTSKQTSYYPMLDNMSFFGLLDAFYVLYMFYKQTREQYSHIYIFIVLFSIHKQQTPFCLIPNVHVHY